MPVSAFYDEGNTVRVKSDALDLGQYAYAAGNLIGA